MGGWGKEESFSDYTVLYGLYLLRWGDLDLGLKFGLFHYEGQPIKMAKQNG